MADDPKTKPAPNPRPLLMVLMCVSLLGGSCAMQGVLEPSREPPSEAEIAKALGEPAAEKGGYSPLVGAAHGLLKEQLKVAGRFHAWGAAFSLALLVAYSFTFVFALRTFHFAPGSVKLLSLAALTVLPTRVAVAAIDVASARALEPATRSMAAALMQARPPDLPADQAQAVVQTLGDLASWMGVAFHAGVALVICALFHAAWRYFERPDVVDFFEKNSVAPPSD